MKRIICLVIVAVIDILVCVNSNNKVDVHNEKIVAHKIYAVEEQEPELPSVEDLAVVEKAKEYVIDVEDSDIDLMARVVMSEASVLNIDAKQAVAATIINRVKSNEFPDTVYGVVYQDNQYSTADNGDPDEECYAAVYAALKNECFPTDMYFFRSDYYHSFGTPYIQINGMYFSRK